MPFLRIPSRKLKMFYRISTPSMLEKNCPDPRTFDSKLGMMDDSNLDVGEGVKLDPNIPTIICLHIQLTDHRIFRPQFSDSRLASKVNLLAFDLRGHGLTKGFKVNRRHHDAEEIDDDEDDDSRIEKETVLSEQAEEDGYNDDEREEEEEETDGIGPDEFRNDLEEHAEDFLAAMDVLGVGKAYVFGVSCGANIALWMAINHPERIKGLMVGSLLPLLGDPPSYAKEVTQMLTMMLEEKDEDEEGKLSAHSCQMAIEITFPGGKNTYHPQEWVQNCQYLFGPHRPPSKLTFAFDISRNRKMFTPEELEKVLAPTMIFRAEDDSVQEFYGNIMQEAKERLGNVANAPAPLIAISDAPHGLTISSLLNRYLLQFIERFS